MHSFTVAAITDRRTDQKAPATWEDLLGWWDGQRLATREALRKPPETPVKSPFPRGEVTVGDWVRRLAHEVAIHRLDAESALAVDPATRFDPVFATDGVDEFLAFLTPRRAPEAEHSGTIHVTTTDTGRTWSIHLTEREVPETRAPAQDTPDVRLEGPADEVYRALWGRPHAAAVTGSSGLLGALAAP